MAEIMNSQAARFRLPLLCFIVGQKCNLKCKHCANFTPLLPQTYSEFEDLKRDILTIARVAQIDLLQIQGGEPIGYPFLAELVNYMVDLGFASQVQIATNAVQPLTDAQIAAFRRADAVVRISNYNVVSKSVTRMVSQCVENGIRHWVYQFAAGNGEWLDLGGIDIKEMSAGEGQNNFESCPFKTCLTLENGILARCSRGTTAHLAQHFTPYGGDHLSVRGWDGIAEFGQRLFDYTRNPKAMRACALCRGGNTGYVEAGAQFTRAEVTELLAQSY